MKASLVLEGGMVFEGRSIGASGSVVGEVVFHTSMTGYQEILTDPSYAGQLITMTYPHIGNVGTHPDDEEHQTIHARGLIIRDLPLAMSHWRIKQSLSDYLNENQIIGISDIDTRQLIHVLREKGAQRGCLTTELDNHAAQTEAEAFPGLNNCDLAKVVSTQKVYEFTEGMWQKETGFQKITKKSLKHHVVVVDFGVKRNILHALVSAGCHLTVVPAQTTAKAILALKPDGVVLPNGPGDPAACDYAIEATAALIESGVPILGICLGHQILALASGGRTLKMPFGHHGGNHPVQDVKSKKVMITSQNHSFCVEKESLPECFEVTHISLFDQTLQGCRHKKHPILSTQGHPEASPGPHDAGSIFAQFVKLIRDHHAKTR